MKDCIEATQKASADGYARTTILGKTKYAHRLAYEAEVGIIPKDMTIDHLCRNKNCINVSHMEIVSTAENTRRRFIGVTHCKNGHLYNTVNTATQKHVNGNIYKRCKLCRNNSNTKYRQKLEARL